VPFLGAYRKIAKNDCKLRRACPPFRLPSWNISVPTLDGFSWNLISVFQKSVEKIEALLNSGKNIWYFTWGLFTFMIASRWILLRMSNFPDESCRENQNTRYMFNNTFSRKLWHLWDTVEKYCRAGQATDDIIRPMCFACWISRITHIHSEYVILIAFPRQRWFLGRASVWMLNVYWLSCIFLFRNSPEGTGCNAGECVSDGGVLPNRDWVTLLSECFMLLCSELFSRYVK
jgi:hypothetical protein